MRKLGLLGTSALRSAAFIGFAAALAAPSFAQTAQPDSSLHADQPEALGQNEVELESGQAATSSEAIVVTGSRISRPNLESTVPITSFGVQELTQRGDLSLGDALNQMPALRATFSQANSTGSIGTAGLNLLDLRGLGTSRTLVLVNGRRHVSVQPGNYVVDVNTIPSDLVERVDVVTGGNSAIYGSDAIAGVVNFVLKKDYEGVKLRGQGGVSTYGDRGSYFVSGIAGKNFFDGRLNATLSLEYARSNEVFYSDRDYLGAISGTPGFVNAESTGTPNRNTNGIPNTRFHDINNGQTPGIVNYIISTAGTVIGNCPAPAPAGSSAAVIAATNARIAAVCTGQTNPTGGRLAHNYVFMPDGTLVRDIPFLDERNIGGSVFGGRAATGFEGAMLLPGLERYNANLLLSGDISEAIQPFLEAKYVRVTATQQSTQPTFINSTLNPVFSINNPFLTAQARAQLVEILGVTATGAPVTTFNMNRFNNDLGTRAEDHLRETYRLVVGTRGDLSDRGNLRYELAFNYGRTETFYETGGNVLVANFNRATNAVRNAAGQIVCAVNADAITTNDDPACVPLNVFGYGATQQNQAALDYVLHVSSRDQWAEQINATAFISGDSSGFFELPGGPVGFALGAEYRKEDAFSDYDDVTQSGATFLNAFATFAPPAVEIKEAFGELRIPLLRDMPFFHELSLEGAARVSDYGGTTGSVWAYNLGATWAPVRDVRLRGTYARSVRAPNLNNLYQTSSVTFANNLTDPCDQPGGNNASNNITKSPERARNCAAAGVPTTITYTDSSGNLVTQPWRNIPGSGIQGVNQGNPNLVPEVGISYTFGAVVQPRFLPGLSVSVDYYNIKITDVISGLTGQAIIDRCYDDPGGIDNPFCAAVNRRTTTDPTSNGTFAGQSARRLDNRPDVVLPVTGPGFINQPFNFAKLTTSGIDADVSYRTRLGGETTLNLHGVVSWVESRKSYAYISTPDRYDRIDTTLGDPEWQASFTANLDLGKFDLTYNARYVGKQIVSGLAYEQFFPSQGRPAINAEARPFVFYDPVVYHGFRINFEPTKQFGFYAGVDNVTNELPPYELSGTESFSSGSTASVYPNTGRFFYAGAEVKF